MRRTLVPIGILGLLFCIAFNASPITADVGDVNRATGWEYKLVDLIPLVQRGDNAATEKAVEERLNELGTKGWEICTNINSGLILKRPTAQE